MNKKYQKGSILLVLGVMVVFIAVIILASYFTYLQYKNSANQNQSTQTSPDATANWNVVKNDDAGFQFKYPTDFGSKYASFQSNPVAVVSLSDSKNIDSNGCYIIDLQIPNKDSQVTINGIQFCLSVISDPGAGQLYTTSNYTIMKNGTGFITLQYVVHMPNGCSPYMGTPDYQPCTDFLNNYDVNVTKVIENSVSTLQFTK